MLAGGINPENIAEAIKVGCLGVILNSGVEGARHQRCRQNPACICSTA